MRTRTTREYLHFLVIALGSACELRYLVGLAHRLEILFRADFVALETECHEVVRMMQALVAAISTAAAS